jgi:predicted nuclease with RNAse H fold
MSEDANGRQPIPPPDRPKTGRGIRLKGILAKRRYRVVEVYPGAAQDLWNIGRKQDGLLKLRRGLQGLGVKGLSKEMSGDELDAITAALVGQWFLRGKAEVLGHFRHGAIIIPYAKEIA